METGLVKAIQIGSYLECECHHGCRSSEAWWFCYDPVG